ncbi:unnamed protein product [Moneuplotes crassus]|uniref:Uncharacterized protein n=1 Tax=Euplotes crassus TaxID=5936 RepID=A0AAD1U3W6_EUPCR|nr:unnamed protein product [Moneuplotes crassus]
MPHLHTEAPLPALRACRRNNWDREFPKVNFEELTQAPPIQSFLMNLGRNKNIFNENKLKHKRSTSKKRKKETNSFGSRHSYNTSPNQPTFENSFASKIRGCTGADEWKSTETLSRLEFHSLKQRKDIKDLQKQKVLNFKALRMQKQEQKLARQRLLAKAKRNKCRSEVKSLQKRNTKLKKQLAEWEQQKEQKEQQLLEQLQKEKERKNAQSKREKQQRKFQLEKIKQYKIEAQKSQSQMDQRQLEKDRFILEICKKKNRLKQEINKLRQSQRTGVPRYDLNTSELLRPVQMSSSRDDIIPEEPIRSRAKSKSPKVIRRYFKKYGQNHIEAIAHLNTTVSALGVYNNPLPTLRRVYR